MLLIWIHGRLCRSMVIECHCGLNTLDFSRNVLHNQKALNAWDVSVILVNRIGNSMWLMRLLKWKVTCWNTQCLSTGRAEWSLSLDVRRSQILVATYVDHFLVFKRISPFKCSNTISLLTSSGTSQQLASVAFVDCIDSRILHWANVTLASFRWKQHLHSHRSHLCNVTKGMDQDRSRLLFGCYPYKRRLLSCLQNFLRY